MDKVIYIVATPIGNLGDISFRGIEVLKSVDYILAEDTRHSRILLDHYGIKTRVASFHKFNESEMLQKIASILDEYPKIALISDAGTPLISDPGASLVEYALNSQISIVPIPGASALTTLLSVSGFSTLHNNVTFAGFLSHTENAKKGELETLLASGDIFAFFDSPKRIDKTIKLIASIDPMADIVIGRELTKIHEEILRFKASNQPERIMDKGEFTVLVKPSVKKSNKNNLMNKSWDSKSETKKTAAILANYLNIQAKEAYTLLIKLKEEFGTKE
ncbi:MAG: 16S rRNA (cytidine(1402)-2'-O)-methyltransferase [bacterium]